MEKCLFDWNHWGVNPGAIQVRAYVFSWFSAVMWWYSWAILWPKRAFQGGRRLPSNQLLVSRWLCRQRVLFSGDILVIACPQGTAVLFVFQSASLLSSYALLINVSVKVSLWSFLCNLRGLLLLIISLNYITFNGSAIVWQYLEGSVTPQLCDDMLFHVLLQRFSLSCCGRFVDESLDLNT
jgi:hypothetical protein